MARIKEQILCDTTSIIEYDVYIEHCEINDLTPQGEDSEDFYNVAREYQVLEFDDLLANLRYCEANNYKWVVSGTLGLWNGRHEIEPTLFNNLIDALNAERELWHAAIDVSELCSELCHRIALLNVLSCEEVKTIKVLRIILNEH